MTLCHAFLCCRLTGALEGVEGVLRTFWSQDVDAETSALSLVLMLSNRPSVNL